MNGKYKGAAVGSGFGSGVITVWVWNSIIVPYYGLPEMPSEVAVAFGGAVVYLFGEVLQGKS